MFLRQHRYLLKGQPYEYLKLCQNVRQEGKVRQKVLVNFGNVTHWPPERLRKLIAQLQAFVGDPVGGGPELEKVQLGRVVDYAPVIALDALWSQTALGPLLRQAAASRGIEFDLARAAQVMIYNRLLEPTSKLALPEWAATQYRPGSEKLRAHHYYRALDLLEALKVRIEKHLFRQLNDLFSLDLSLVFYDLTSSYFEGAHCPIARRGYSRDHRPDLLQIELGLLVNRRGIPIAHEVFAGQVKDSATLPRIVRVMKERFGIKQCILVGDAGTICDRQIEELKGEHVPFITSVKLRASSEGLSLVPRLPERSRFIQSQDNLWIHELGSPLDDGDRYIACYNPARAQHEQDKRTRQLAEGQAILEDLKQPRKQGRTKDPAQLWARAQRVLKAKGLESLFRTGIEGGRLTWQVDSEALQAEQQRDGLAILRTSAPTLSAEDIALGYRTLWQVEAAFKQIKHFEMLRPIRHWTEPRVKGHVLVCVLAYLLERLLEQRLEEAHLELTAPRALGLLRTHKAVQLKLEDHQLFKTSPTTEPQRRILNALGIAAIPELVENL